MHFSIAIRTILVVLVLAACQSPPPPNPALFETPASKFDYRWEDPLVATVVGTPPDQQADLPRTYPIEIIDLEIFADRRPPPYFWYARGLTFALSAQPREAPLVFVIAGTGGSATSRTTEKLVRVLYAGGFHVLAVTSPTHPDFVISGSSTGAPGRVGVDARDLYHAMDYAYRHITPRLQVSSVSLTGYSLGAMHAAFIADLDQRERKLDFQRVLMINPPVSLYRSMDVIDEMLIENVPGGMAALPAYVDRLLTQVIDLFVNASAPSDFTGGFLYQAYQRLQPSDQALAALVGLSFRMSALDLAFSADVVTNVGYIVPSDRRLVWTTPVTRYWVAGIQRGFGDYLDGLLFPFYQSVVPNLTRAELVHEATLERLASFLATTPTISLITNEDDIIYTPGDLTFLREIFGDRGEIFPRGGHCGNIEYPHVVAAILTSLAVDGEQ